MPIKDLEKRKEYHRKYNKSWYQKNKDKYVKVCRECGIEYTSRYQTSKFCSIECSGKGRSNKQNCILCGNIFFAPPSKNRKYCSQRCMMSDPNTISRMSDLGKRFGKRSRSENERAQISARQIGDKNHQWDGGITPEYKRLRNLKIYKDWRKKIFERDNYTCVLCGDRNGNGHYVELNADHYPIQFKTLLKENKTYKMWDIDNGRTLCIKCHKKVTFRV